MNLQVGGLNSYQYYFFFFGGGPYYSYSIMGPQTLSNYESPNINPEPQGQDTSFVPTLS